MSRSDVSEFPQAPTWSKSEKAIAGAVFDGALRREVLELIKEAKRRANQMQQPSQLWDLQYYLTERRKEVDRKYDYRYSQLTNVFGRLLYEKRISVDELSGLGENKLKPIRSLAELLTKDAAGLI